MCLHYLEKHKSQRYLDKSTVLMVFLNDCNDLKSTTPAGRSFHTFITLMLNKDVLALQWLTGLNTTDRGGL